MSDTRQGSEEANAAAASSSERAVSWDAFLSTYLPALVLAIGTGIALPAIPTLAKTYAVSFGMASGIVTAFVLGNVVGTIPSGWLIDRFGNRVVLISAPLITSITSFAIFFSDDFTEFLILRLLTGMAAQMWQMARLAAISYGAAPSQRGRLVSWMFGMDSTGRLAGPIIGGFIAAGWGPRAPFIVFAAMALIALVPTSTFGKDTPRQSKGDKKAVRTISLRDLILPRLVYFGVALFAGMTRGPLNADLLHLYAAFAYTSAPSRSAISRPRHRACRCRSASPAAGSWTVSAASGQWCQASPVSPSPWRYSPSRLTRIYRLPGMSGCSSSASPPRR